MSSVLRSVRSLKKPDQNTSWKVTTLLFDDDNDAWLKFSCNDGVYELTGDTQNNSADDIIDNDNIEISGLVNCKYSGGLRIITEIGPKLTELLQKMLLENGSFTVLNPGQSSRVQILASRDISSFIGYGNYEMEVDVPYSNVNGDIGIPGVNGIAITNAVDSQNSLWIVKEPVTFEAEDGSRYMLFNPLGDDVYTHEREAFAQRSVSSSGLLTCVKPLNKSAAKKHAAATTKLAKKIEEKKAEAKAKRAAAKAAKAATAAAAAEPTPSA